MLRAALFYLCLITVPALANPQFDSLFTKSDVVIYGQIVRHEISPFQWDLGTRNCTFDIRVDVVCQGGRTSVDSINLPQPGDTLRNIDYFGGDDADTLNIYVTYIMPLYHDSIGKWHLLNQDYEYGVFTDYRVMRSHCPVVFTLDPNDNSQILKHVTSERGRWAITETYDSKNIVRRKTKRRFGRSKWILIDRTYSENGKSFDHTRTKNNPGKYGMKTVIWRFRSAGKICLSRRKIFSEQVNR